MKRTALKRTGMKKRKKSVRQTIMKRLDSLFSDVVIARDGCCQVCSKTGHLQCSHILCKQKDPNLRYELLNALAMCVGCHLYWWHLNPLDGASWFATTFPARYKYLNENRRLIKWSTADLPGIEARLKEKLKELQNERPVCPV